MRVIGSHAISTRPLASFTGVLVAIVPTSTRPCSRSAAACPGFATSAPRRRSSAVILRRPRMADAVQLAGRGRDPASPGGSSMKGMNLSGKPGMVQPMQMPPDVRAAAHAVDPAPLGDVALHHRAPAAELHDALGRAVLGGEVALLVVAGPVAALVHGGAEQPRAAAGPRRGGSSGPGRWPGRAGTGGSRTCCPGGPGSRARTRWGGRPWTSSPSPGSRARPWRRWGCRPWRGCRRRWRRCRRPRTARALGARRSSHSLVVMGWSVSGLLPNPHQ